MSYRDFESVSLPWREVIPAFMEEAQEIGLDVDRAATVLSELGRYALEDAVTAPDLKAALRKPTRVDPYHERKAGVKNGRPRMAR